jgi:hypothetical protein
LFVDESQIFALPGIRALNKVSDLKDIVVLGFSNSDIIDLLLSKASFIRQRAFEMGKSLLKC